jgi:DNA-binding response OmpR family regulator
MKTILIIDDEQDLCALLKKALSKEDYRVDCAFSLMEADIKLQTHPEIVLLDNNLPDGTGISYLHGHPEDFRKTCVIMISADSSLSLELNAKQVGVRAIIHKPFSVSLVRELIRGVA